MINYTSCVLGKTSQPDWVEFTKIAGYLNKDAVTSQRTVLPVVKQLPSHMLFQQGTLFFWRRFYCLLCFFSRNKSVSVVADRESCYIDFQ